MSVSTYGEEMVFTKGPVVTPIQTKPAPSTIKEQFEETMKVVKDTINSFEDAVPGSDSSSPLGDDEKAFGFLRGFQTFIQSKLFHDSVVRESRFSGLPPKTIANNFFEKVLGTIGDICGIGIKIVHNSFDTLVTVIGVLLKGSANIACKIADGLVSLVTLNKTNRVVL